MPYLIFLPGVSLYFISATETFCLFLSKVQFPFFFSKNAILMSIVPRLKFGDFSVLVKLPVSMTVFFIGLDKREFQKNQWQEITRKSVNHWLKWPSKEWWIPRKSISITEWRPFCRKQTNISGAGQVSRRLWLTTSLSSLFSAKRTFVQRIRKWWKRERK